MVLTKIGLLLEAIAVMILTFKVAWFTLMGDFSSGTVDKFVSEILTFGVEQSIPLEVTIIQIFGGVGAILIALDAIVAREV